ncbi:hypothetical protein BHM03_00015137 [Ensete ventricosum]|nr:hypothetical protein BHM03_00015137 [Ensete ventricosum]
MESKTPIWRKRSPPHPWHPPPTEHLVDHKAEDDIGPKQQGLRRTGAKKLASRDPSEEHGSRGMQTEIAANLIMSDAERDSQSNFASIRSTDDIGVSEMAHRWRRPSPETRWFYFDLSSSERTERSRRLKDLKRQTRHINVAVRRERRFGGEGTQLG